MSALLDAYLSPAIQIFLGLSLFVVAILLVRVESKLNAFKKGTDGMVDATKGMIDAISKAEVALAALKAAEAETRERMSQRLEEAKAAADTLKFLSSASDAIAHAPPRDSRRDEEVLGARVPWKTIGKTITQSDAQATKKHDDSIAGLEARLKSALEQRQTEAAPSMPPKENYRPDAHNEPQLPRAHAARAQSGGNYARRWEDLR